MKFGSDPLRDYHARPALLAGPTIGLNFDPRETDTSPPAAHDGMMSPAAIMEANLASLFCAPAPDTRQESFDALWHSNATIYELEEGRAGRQAVLAAAQRFSMRMAGLTCTPMWPVSGHNDLYMLRWVALDRGEPVLTGSQIGFITAGRIHAFYMIDD